MMADVKMQKKKKFKANEANIFGCLENNLTSWKKLKTIKSHKQEIKCNTSTPVSLETTSVCSNTCQFTCNMGKHSDMPG